jgi:hypothetical protein
LSAVEHDAGEGVIRNALDEREIESTVSEEDRDDLDAACGDVSQRGEAALEPGIVVQPDLHHVDAELGDLPYDACDAQRVHRRIARGRADRAAAGDAHDGVANDVGRARPARRSADRGR